MTMQNEQTQCKETAGRVEPPAAAPTMPKAPAKEKPVRRVGSVTLGIALIAAGVFFLLYYFVPGFNWMLAAKLSPVLVVALGVEVLVCSFRPDRAKYDFLAILACLVLMAAGFCVTLLPMVWEYAGPGNSLARETLASQYENELYAAMRGGRGGALALDSLNAWVELPFGSKAPQSLDELDASATLGVSLYLSGPYESREAFAADCRRVLDAIQAQDIQPHYVYIAYVVSDGRRSYTLDLHSRVQLDWSEAQILRGMEAYDPEEEEIRETEAVDEPLPDEIRDRAD